MSIAGTRLRERRGQTIALWVYSAAEGRCFNARPGSGPESHAWQARSDAGICLTGLKSEGGVRLI
jgi:hypothetical protein